MTIPGTVLIKKMEFSLPLLVAMIQNRTLTPLAPVLAEICVAGRLTRPAKGLARVGFVSFKLH